MIAKFVVAISKYCQEQKIVTHFFRFHPLLNNGHDVKNVINVSSMKQTIYMDTTSEELIWNNMESSRRNRIRKVEKEGITVSIDRGEHVKEFIEIYNSTMTEKMLTNTIFFNLPILNIW